MCRGASRTSSRAGFLAAMERRRRYSLFLLALGVARATSVDVGSFAALEDAVAALGAGSRDARVAANVTVVAPIVLFARQLEVAPWVTLTVSSYASEPPPALSGSGANRLFLLRIDSKLELRGVTLTHGRAVSGFGGAIYASERSALELVGVGIEFSTATFGGAVFAAAGATIAATDSWMAQNSAVWGAVVEAQDAAVRLEACLMKGNSADFGGAVSLRGRASLAAARCLLLANSATTSGGVVSALDNATVALSSCTAQKNIAKWGGVVTADHTAEIAVVASTLTDNRAYEGGAVVSFKESRVALRRTLVHENVATMKGGALHVGGASRVNLTSCTFEFNSASDLATTYGGVLHAFDRSAVAASDCLFANNSAMLGGALSSNEGSSLSLVSCHVASNAAHWGGAVYTGDESAFDATGCEFRANHAELGGAVAGLGNHNALYQHNLTLSIVVRSSTFEANSAGQASAAVCSSVSHTPAPSGWWCHVNRRRDDALDTSTTRRRRARRRIERSSGQPTLTKMCVLGPGRRRRALHHRARGASVDGRRGAGRLRAAPERGVPRRRAPSAEQHRRARGLRALGERGTGRRRGAAARHRVRRGRAWADLFIATVTSYLGS